MVNHVSGAKALFHIGKSVSDLQTVNCIVINIRINQGGKLTNLEYTQAKHWPYENESRLNTGYFKNKPR